MTSSASSIEAPLKNDFDTLAADYVEQHEGRSIRTLFTAFEFRDIVCRQIQVVRKNGLTNVALLAKGFNFIACESDGSSWRHAEMPHSDFIVRGLGQKAAPMHVTRGFQQLLG
jgi:hypothetical protein